MNNTIQSFDVSILEVDKDKKLVNLTKMAKHFNKRPVDWLRLDSTKAYLESYAEITGKVMCDFLTSLKGNKSDGAEQGTWADKKVAIKFAQWINPKFEVFCTMKLDELFTNGSTSIVPQSYAQALLEAGRLALELEQKSDVIYSLETTLDVLEQWVSIKHMSKELGVHESSFEWHVLKSKSIELGMAIKKAVCPRFGYMNLYHREVFRSCYPLILKYNS